jgi:ssDNA-binding Zn-finger/Zn-ribbon topoisomerase 1
MPVPDMTKKKVQHTRSLLDMMYKPAEIARDLGVTVDTIYRSYLPAGAPCEKDAKGNVWIHGESFANWAKIYLEHRRPHGRARVLKEKMLDDQVYCLKCNQVVQPAELHNGRPNGHGVTNRYGKCPQCGHRVFRFIKVEVKSRPHDQPE